MSSNHRKSQKGSSGSNIYCSGTPVVEKKYEEDSYLSPAETVVEVMAEAAEVDATELDPLYQSVDPDSIDMLVESYSGSHEAAPHINFEINDWTVFIRGDGIIRIFDTTQTSGPAPIFEELAP